jgi:hypothetical protein
MLGASQQDSKWLQEPDYDLIMQAYSVVADLKERIPKLKRRIEKLVLPYKEQYPRSPWKYAHIIEREEDELTELESLLAAAEIEIKKAELQVKMFQQCWYNKLQGKG